MKIRNSTKRTILSHNAKRANSWKEKSIGLIGTKEPTTLVIHTSFGIHTFGMRYALDVLILDKKNRVATYKENLQPNRIFLWKPTYDTVIELPAGTIEKTKTELHDVIIFE